MATLLETMIPQRLRRRRAAQEIQKPAAQAPRRVAAPPVDIAPDDPIIAYFLSAPGAVELDKLRIESPALEGLKKAGIKVAVPLVSQGELIGVLNLGPRLSQQDYSTDDRGLLNTLATQAAPAVRVAQLVREQQAQARERERIEQELRIARLIQQTLLPKELPELPGWHVEAYYQPARAVGGDFYDFMAFEDGRMGLVVGDVTDKGVPAALVMATTRSILRAAAQHASSPGAVLQRANDLLCPDIPPKMFVTCLYAVLDPDTGRLCYANAGHDLPYQRRDGEASELRATGMPLGLMPGMRYEEKETVLAPGESLLLYSDGLVEAHAPDREMFGFPRLARLLGQHLHDVPLVEFLLNELRAFTGPDWEQEDDVTLVTLQHKGAGKMPEIDSGAANWRPLDAFTVPSEPGNERIAMKLLESAVRDLNLPARRLENLKTAVAEATMNAMEHGNNYHADQPVRIELLTAPGKLLVRITDEGTGPAAIVPENPDIEAKLAELQKPRGWGLFLIKNLVDDMRVTSDGGRHTVELILSLEGASNG